MAVIKSKFSDFEIENVSITEFVFEGLSEDPDRVVVIDGMTGKKTTAAALIDNIKKLAGGLVERNLATGRTIAIMSPNVPEYFTIFHGVAWAGGTITTINPNYTAHEAHHQLKDANANILIVHPDFLGTAREAVIGTVVEEIISIGETHETTSLAQLMGEPLNDQAPVDLNNHVVVLPYSSGTTGLPKGVMLTHRNLVANLGQVNSVMALRKNSDQANATPAFLPFFHIYGLLIFLNLYPASGGTVITMPRFDLQDFLRLAQDHKSINLWIVPPVAMALARHPAVDDYDLSCVEMIFSGAAPLGAELSHEVGKRLNCFAVQGYGMTELSPVCHLMPQSEPRVGSVGLTIAGTSCRIVNLETGEDMNIGEEGEIWIKGPQVMKGYLDNPQATARMIDSEGWLRTGDVGYFDKDQYLYIVDRVKELIKYKGFQVAPAELEAVLINHPDVADAAVIGIQDDEAGELPMAFIIANKGASPSLDAIQTHMGEHLASFKQVRRVELVETIPKSASGKILRRLLREQITK
ncbi:MAG: 4-coumarate--CoA ligase family protein [Hyphomicrobiales bacterium]|nr:4-coumarate--CoA ligase family protein [Hyphomicrobiales bacterium]